ncbi:MAG: Nucleoside triphosphate pyrophosphohydrolase [candidate division BRC1 bacterium ADurb.BinA292]|nr:MAG: Nucleoside triphosphate pyrophosphohydrolase [candidate division BRC1 bacterium ADurb.BinA292]
MSESPPAVPENSADNSIAPHDFDQHSLLRITDPFSRLRVIMKRLLDPGGCPWDREQTHQTLRQYLIEEAYEAAEAIEEGDMEALCEELGDVGLQVVFHAELAERAGVFRIEDVYDRICNKLIVRHPHVFGDVHAPDAEAVLRNWEQLKKRHKREKAERAGEGGHASAISGVPRSLPALQRAARLQDKASHVGFDWEKAEDVAAKVQEEVEEFLTAARTAGQGDAGAEETGRGMEEEFGDLLFSLVNLSRFLGIHAEESLQRACEKFRRRFTSVEQAADAAGRPLSELTLAEMDRLWDEIKAREKNGGGPMA